MPLIENCFKHVSGYPDKENTIFIVCRMDQETFQLNTRNSIVENLEPDADIGGIGLKNVRKRLKLVYPDRHELITGYNGVFYEASLRIKIEPSSSLK